MLNEKEITLLVMVSIYWALQGVCILFAKKIHVKVKHGKKLRTNIKDVLFSMIVGPWLFLVFIDEKTFLE